MPDAKNKDLTPKVADPKGCQEQRPDPKGDLLVEGESYFKPVLYFYPNDFQGFVAANEAIQYCLEIIASGYTAKRYQVFEVAWDGT